MNMAIAISTTEGCHKLMSLTGMLTTPSSFFSLLFFAAYYVFFSLLLNSCDFECFHGSECFYTCVILRLDIMISLSTYEAPTQNTRHRYRS